MRLPRSSLALLIASLAWASPVPTEAQESRPSLPSPDVPSPISNEDLLRELRQLKSEVADTRRLKDQVIQLQNEVANLRSAPVSFSPSAVAPRPDFSSLMGGTVEGSGSSLFRGGQPRSSSDTGRSGRSAKRASYERGGQPLGDG